MGGAHILSRNLLFTFVWILLCRSSIGQHCGHPGRPAFTEFDPSAFYEVGEKVSYKCIDGYLLNSPFRNYRDFASFGQRECLPNETWSHDNVYCYRRLTEQTLRCDGRYVEGRQQYRCLLPQTSDSVSDLLLITSLYRGIISGLNVYSCEKYFDEAQRYSTSSALFRFPLDKNSSECHPLLDEQVSVTTSAWDRILVTPYARNNLCGTPETPANGKLIRINATTVRYVCNSGYQLEGNEYRNCVDSFWNGTQVICNKTTDEYDSGQVNICGTPETPTNGKLIRINATTIRYVCNSGYQLEGNEYRNFVDSLWNGTQVICNKTTDEYDSSQLNGQGSSNMGVVSLSISLVAIAVSILTLLIQFGVVFFKRSKPSDRINQPISERAPSVIYMNTGIGAIGSTESETYPEIQVNNAVPANDNIYEQPNQSSTSQLVEVLYAQPTRKNQRK